MRLRRVVFVVACVVLAGGGWPQPAQGQPSRQTPEQDVPLPKADQDAWSGERYLSQS